MAEDFDACRTCGAGISGEGRYCSHCGSALYVICPGCGRRNARANDRCSGCKEVISAPGGDVEPPVPPAHGRPLERRQLTIMFTDLIDSTGLADSMDPEDFRVLIEAHRTIAVSPIARFGGTVARYLGDGMLVLFGYPEAHEDDPERAVRAGLEVVAATARMNERWVGEGKGRIAVRIGVHTGIVVVGDVLKADVKEIMAVFGNAPSIASRLQALAKPNGVVLSGATKQLLPSAILCETRGKTVLRGVSRPVEIYSALKVRDGVGDRRVGGRVLPFVNREKELATIRRCWAEVRRGEGRCLVIEGDPGMGKSRLIRAVEERIVTQPSRWLITRTSPYAANTDFYAFSELFRQVLPVDAPAKTSGSAFDQLRRALRNQGIADPEMALGLASLLGVEIPEKATASPLHPERARELALRAIAAWLQNEAGRQPLVLIVEDLHWADASTLEAIERLKTDVVGHRILFIMTTRGAADPRSLKTSSALVDAAAANVPLAPRSTIGADNTDVVYLERLPAPYAEALLGHVLYGTALPKTAVTTLLQRANGVPLYLEELPKPLIEADRDAGGAPIELPATLRDSLMAQLDRMGEAKTVAQTAAVLGHRFERPLLEHVWEGSSESLEAGLLTLADAAIMRPESDMDTAAYGFRHALLAEIAYDSILRHERQRIHRKTAESLNNHFAFLVESRPEILARHEEASGNIEDAFDCWLAAGMAAAKRSANAEALAHFSNADAMMERLSKEGAAGLNERRLTLCLARAPVQSALFGWSAAEVERTYKQALDLSDSVGAAGRSLFNIWRGLYNVYLLRGDIVSANAVVHKLGEIAKKSNDNELLFSWLSCSGSCSFFSAEFEEANNLFGEALNLINDPRNLHGHVSDPAVIAYSLKAWTNWFLGKISDAVALSRESVRAAEQSESPFDLCYALCLKSSLDQCRNRPHEVFLSSSEALALADLHAFPYWRAWALVLKGWSLSLSGQADQGVALIEEGVALYNETGATQMRSYILCLLAEAYQVAERFDKASGMAKAAVAETRHSQIVFYESEAYRLLGESLYRLSSGSGDALGSMLRAVRIAGRRDCHPLYVKSAFSLIDKLDRAGLRRLLAVRARRSLEILEQSSPPDDRFSEKALGP